MASTSENSSLSHSRSLAHLDFSHSNSMSVKAVPELLLKIVVLISPIPQERSVLNSVTSSICDCCNNNGNRKEGNLFGGRRGHSGGSRSYHTTDEEEFQPSSSSQPSVSPHPSQVQLEQLIKDYARMQSSKDCGGSTSVTQSGNIGSALNSRRDKSKDSWVVDSGATDHMSTESNLFSTYNPNPSKPCILTTDGSPIMVSGEGRVPITSSMSLSTVLHVPNLSCNLLSISQITKALKCKVTFYETHCVFQDLLTGATLGLGKERGGLYYLELQEAKENDSLRAYKSTSMSSSEEQIWLWHKQLGHPSGIYKICSLSCFQKLIYLNFIVKLVN